MKRNNNIFSKRGKFIVSAIMSVVLGMGTLAGIGTAGYAMDLVAEQQIENVTSDGAMDSSGAGITVSKDAVISTADAVKIASLHNPIIDASTEAVTFSYVYFGSYPQSEVTGEALTEEIIQADYASLGIVSEMTEIDGIINYAIDGEAVVSGVKYRRMAGEDGSFRYFRYEPIKWRVMEVNGREICLLSDTVLAGGAYGVSSKVWSEHDVRMWLNGYNIDKDNFLDSAFTEEEMNAIIPMRIAEEYMDDPTVYYEDKVTLWSCEDAKETLLPASALRMKASDYGWCCGLMKGEKQEGYVNWWLNDGAAYGSAPYMDSKGELHDLYSFEENSYRYGRFSIDNPSVGICPMLILNLEQTDLWKIQEEMDKASGVQKYSITEVRKYQDGIQILCNVPEKCRVIAALYGEEGKMCAFGITDLIKEQKEAVVQWNVMPDEGDYQVKVFMVDNETQKPLCRTYSGYVEDVGIKERGKCGENVYYTVDYHGTMRIYGKGDMYDYGKHEVTPFSGNHAVRRLIIEEGLTSVGNYAFRNMRKLEQVIFPDTVMDVGEEAMRLCTSLKQVQLPKNLKKLNDGTFMDCISLEKIQLPEGLGYMGHSLFSDCESLQNITIPDTVTDMKSGVFSGCTALQSIQLSNNLKKIPHSAFYNCRSLISVVIPEAVTAIEERAFCLCYNLENITLPKNLLDIGDDALNSTKWFETKRMEDNVIIVNDILLRLTRITENEDGVRMKVVPDGVKAIAGGVLTYDGIIKIPSSVIWINEQVFESESWEDGVGDNTRVYVPEGSYAEEFMKTTGMNYYIEKADGSVEEVIVSGSAVEAGETIDDYQCEVSVYSEISGESAKQEIKENALSSDVFADENIMAVSSNKTQTKQAEFYKITGNAEYLLVVVRDKKEDLFASDNLLYINQYTAGTEGKVGFDYVLEAGITEYQIVLFSDSEISPIPVTEYKMGDVNMDGQITLADARLTLKSALKIIVLSQEQYGIADITENGIVALDDAQKILRKALRIEE